MAKFPVEINTKICVDSRSQSIAHGFQAGKSCDPSLGFF